MLNHIIQELITKTIEKQTEKIITKKSQKKIQQEEVIFNKPHLFVSGYYQAYAFLFACPILIIVLLLCIFSELLRLTLRLEVEASCFNHYSL